MGTIHKLPPPKNEQQFKGYHPLGTGRLFPKQPRRSLAFWRRLRPWQQAAIAWMLLIATATIVVGIGALLRR